MPRPVRRSRRAPCKRKQAPPEGDGCGAELANWFKLLTAPPEINLAFLKVWDEFAAAESAKSPFFKKVFESQREYASKVVPAKRFMTPPYTLQADHYWPNKQ